MITWRTHTYGFLLTRFFQRISIFIIPTTLNPQLGISIGKSSLQNENENQSSFILEQIKFPFSSNDFYLKAMITILLLCQGFSPPYLTTVNLNNPLTFKPFLIYGSLSTSVKLDHLLTLGFSVTLKIVNGFCWNQVLQTLLDQCFVMLCFYLLVIDICEIYFYHVFVAP